MADGPERLDRPRVAALDAILGETLPVLDQGFVRVVDYMGDDLAIVQAARVSYGAGTRSVREDRGLIRYLMRHRHTSPFEMCELKLHLRLPMDCWRQWIRHRTASVNEYSTRYSIAIDEAAATAPDAWRRQAADNRQGSEGRLDDAAGAALSEGERRLQAEARRVYEARLAAGVAREQARKDLPLSTYTEAYWKIDLHNLLHFLGLRMEAHAQEEIRRYAAVIGEQVVARWVPLTWEAFLDFRLGGTSLSRLEAELVGLIGRGEAGAALARAREAGLLGVKDGRPVVRGELRELEAKLAAMGLDVPWRQEARAAGEDGA